MSRITLIFAFSLVSLFALAQNVRKPNTAATANKPISNVQSQPIERQPLYLTARYQADSVVLRWAPGTAPAWRAAILSGYVIEKAVIEKGRPVYKRLTSTKAFNRDSLLSIYQLDKSRSAALALATLYNETAVKPESLNLDQMKTKAQAFQLVFGYNLLSSDLDPQVANWSGLRWVDRDLKPGLQYGYRVYFAKPVSGLSDTAYVLVDTRFPDTLPQPPAMKVTEAISSVKLEWTFAPEQFSAWWIEKSKPGKNDFFPLHQYPYTYSDERFSGPMLRSSFADTGLKAYELWEYRLVGITSFGERVVGNERLLAQAKDLTPPAIPEWEEVKQDGKRTTLQWSFNGNSQDLKGFVVMKSEQAEAGFVAITGPLAAEVRAYTDTVEPPTTGVYYQVMAFDTAGNSINSASKLVFGKDSIAPLVPDWVEGIADTNGIVKLKWRASSSSDLQGYRLYRAYASDHAFALVTPRSIVDTFYQDTLMKRSLTTKVFYRLTAEDLSDNVSDLGPRLYVKRPDLVAPEPPVIVSIKSVGEQIELSVLPSQSEDVFKHRLERRRQNENAWESMILPDSAKEKVFIYLDSSFTSNTFMAYRLVAVDSSGNESDYSREASIKTPMRKSDYFNAFKVSWIAGSNKALVEWECKRKEPEAFVALIRQIGNQSPKTIQNFKEEVKQFEDGGLTSGQQVQYWLRYGSAQSEYFTSPVTLTIP